MESGHPGAARGVCQSGRGAAERPDRRLVGEGSTHKVRFLNPELELINIKDPIPTFLSAFGPKARQLTAKLKAGWIGSASYPEREKADLDMRAA